MEKDFIAVEGIVSCPNCGARNRIGTYSLALRPVCGKCKTLLGTAIDTYTPKQPSTFTPHSASSRSDKKRTWMVYLPIALIVGAAATLYMTFTNSSPRSAGSPAYSSSRYQPPASVLPRTWEQPATAAQNRRLPNGTILRRSSLTGNGSLTVVNGLDRDAVAKLVDRANNICQAFFYIAANSAFTMPGIPDGDYRLLFGTGSDWDDATGFFTRNRACSEFNKPVDFETSTRTERRGWDTYVVTYYSENSITLHPVPDGNARTHDVSESEFQKY